MSIDPHAWMATVPMTVILVSMYFQPAESPVKRLWQQMQQLDQDIWNQLGFYELAQGTRRLHAIREACYWMGVGALGCGSLLSFAAFIGWVSGS